MVTFYQFIGTLKFFMVSILFVSFLTAVAINGLSQDMTLTNMSQDIKESLEAGKFKKSRRLIKKYKIYYDEQINKESGTETP